MFVVERVKGVRCAIPALLKPKEGATRERKLHPRCKDPSLKKYFVKPDFAFSLNIFQNEFCTVCEAVGHAKRYYGGQTKSHKCQFGGTSDRTRILIYCSQHIEHFLELMPVVEKPEIVEAKERKLKSLGKKYLVIIASYTCTVYIKATILRGAVNVKLMVVVLYSSVVLLSI